MPQATQPQNFATFEDKVRHVFRKVWDDFFAWEHNYCEQIIRKSIKPPPYKPLQSLSKLRAQIDNSLGQTSSRCSKSIALSPNWRNAGDCIVTPFGPNGELDHGQAEQVHFEHIEIGSGDVLDVKHFGEYEGCAPLDRSIFIGDDADHMPFVPFADDSSFDHLEHMEHYSHLAWQTKKSNPDVEFIMLETAGRLAQERWDGMPVLYRHIDETCLFPVSLEGQEGVVVGLLHKAGQRDFAPWPGGNPRRFLDEIRRRALRADDFTARLNSVNQVFCPNLNCIESFCLTHTNHIELRPARKPPSSQDTIMALVKKPCSNSCFIWNEVGMESFIFEMRPSALPAIDAIERKARKNQMKQAKQKFDGDAGLCQNCALQWREAKVVEVRVGRWGLGLHLLEPVKSGSLVIEYVGEIILPATMASRDDVSRHRGRNYVFGLNETYAVDAGIAGNPARYINHAPEEEANCKAHVYLVNGEHRIGIFAARDIEVGEELLLFYGTEFFENL
ncbi:hypothetical protein EWM64_g3723 [Hericium alpestre]|uniref:SET domain-containing protein n=1 Tax=Hericium alpestre TaxID=135208 RepID=A0A4Z0A1V3_9AGAM|nr:hypothetical protein EWM64_g3723 [Hericium alpestre]